MHTRLDNLYNCTCDDCQAQKISISLSLNDKFKQLLNDGKKAFKHLHKKGNYKPEDLQKEKPYQNLIKSTFEIFNFAIVDNDVPKEMKKALQSDAYLFGSLKTNAQLFEASKLLLNDEGRLKPFSDVSKQFDGLNINYNQNYLEAEYEFAVASSQSAAQWASYGGSDRYNLQYRTAKDERVRASHQALADITLPKEDPFWSSFYPPNGWRCRCVAVEVLKDKYEVSNSDVAMKSGEKATTELGKDGKNRLEIFRFNPGQKQVVFPPTHPYGKVKGADVVKSKFSNIINNSKKIESIKEILSKPLQEQYKTIYNHKSGGRVEMHKLVNTNAEDYKDILNSAKAFSRTGKTVKLLPEINIKDKEARAIIFKGLKSVSSNPDLLVGSEYIDVKRPSAIKNITGKANEASKQGAIVLISDVRLDKPLTESIISARAKAILSEKNKKNYQFNKAYFIVGNKIITKNTTADK